MGCRQRRRQFLGALAVMSTMLVLLFAPAARAEDGSSGGPERKPFAGKLTSAERHPLLEAWKAQKSLGAEAQTAGGGLAPLATGGTPIVGRASMVINSGGNVVYTQNWLGAANNCEVDPGSPTEWNASTAYSSGDHVNGNGFFMAQNSGTSGPSAPSWNNTFGATTSDAGITWVCVGSGWVSGRAYTTGMTIHPVSSGRYFGFNFQAQNNATSSGSEPNWPTTANAMVTDSGGVQWKAIGYYPGSFTGCNPLTMAIKSAGGSDTVIAKEGDSLGSSQLSGWGEFVAMNDSGRVAFKASVVDHLFDNDETGAAIVLAGPGANQRSVIAQSGDTIGGRYMCGIASIIGMNNPGQVVFDGYAYRPGNGWQGSHSYGSGAYVIPTSPNGFVYESQGSGTSGSSEPVWPTGINSTVNDNGIVWQASISSEAYEALPCEHHNNSIVRYSSGPGNELLVAQGSSVGGSTVNGFGTDVYNASGSSGCSTCLLDYDNIDGVINSSGHVPVVLHLADGTQGVYDFTGPGTSTEVARTGGSNPYTSLTPRVTINNSDQVVFGGESGGLAHIFCFTPPSTTVTVVSVGDDVGTRSVGVANGITFASFGNHFDINNSGNIVFQAKLSGTQEGFYFWNASTGQISEILRQADVSGLASEMITVNDSNLVAYLTGSTLQGEQPFDQSEGHESGGAFFWKSGVTQDAISVGDTVAGDTVTSVYAQHLSFARRQLNEAGCLALAYHDQGDDPGFDCSEGGQDSYPCREEGGTLTKGGQLFVSCTSTCPAILLSPPTLPGGAQGVPYTQTITATGGTGPYTFAVTSGSTPGNVNLSSSGSFSGSPSGTGTFDFTVTATDHNGCTGSMDYSIAVGSASQTNLTISPSALTTVTVGATVQYTVTISQSQGTDTLITLTSSDTGIATVPANVTITAGNTTAMFNATGVAVGGPIIITATLPGSFEAPAATDYLQVVEPEVTAAIPVLDGKGLLILFLGLAAAGWLAVRKLG